MDYTRRRITLPDEASRSLTGQSRTDARKQKEARSLEDAVGYQRESRIEDDCGNEALCSEGILISYSIPSINDARN